MRRAAHLLEALTTALMRALAAIEAEGIVVRKPHVIRIAQTL